MKESLFENIKTGLEEALDHTKGELDLPPENIHFVGEPDPRKIRKNLGFTQMEFADFLGLSIKTVQNWEQGRRRPNPSAVNLLRIAEKEPEVFLRVLSDSEAA